MAVAIGGMDHQVTGQLILDPKIRISNHWVLQICDDGSQAGPRPIEGSYRVDCRNLQIRVGWKVARSHRSQSVDGWNAPFRASADQGDIGRIVGSCVPGL